MIIAKEIIDAADASRKAAEKAKEEALWNAIQGKAMEFENLSEIIHNIMETQRYLRGKDCVWGKQFWDAILRTSREMHLDFCNAITDNPATQYGVRLPYEMNGHYRDIYVTEGGVLWGALDNLHTMEDLEDYLSPVAYEPLFNTMVYMIDTLPLFQAELTKKLNGIILK